MANQMNQSQTALLSRLYQMKQKQLLQASKQNDTLLYRGAGSGSPGHKRRPGFSTTIDRRHALLIQIVDSDYGFRVTVGSTRSGAARQSSCNRSLPPCVHSRRRTQSIPPSWFICRRIHRTRSHI